MFNKRLLGIGISFLVLVAVAAPGLQVFAQDDACIPAFGSDTYVVQDGDTLSDVAASLGVSVEALQAANCLQSRSLIMVGQELVVPPLDGTGMLVQQMYRYCQTADETNLICQWMARNGQVTLDDEIVASGLYTQTRDQLKTCTTADCEPLQTQDQLRIHDQTQDCTLDCVPVGDANQNRNMGGKNN